MKKAAAQEILAKPRGFLAAENHLTWFDDAGKWKSKQSRIHDLDIVWIRVNVLTGQTVDGSHQFTIGTGTIGRPAPTLRRKEVSSSEFRTAIRSRLRHREWANVSMWYRVL